MKAQSVMQDFATQARLVTDLAEAAFRTLGEGCSPKVVAEHLRYTAALMDPDKPGPSAVPPPSDGSVP